jgi:hypothetical protein
MELKTNAGTGQARPQTVREWADENIEEKSACSAEGFHPYPKGLPGNSSIFR